MNCPTHAAQPIVGACTRCGNFVCALDSREVKARRYCFDCARRLVDHLATLRDEYWGRRDGWAWVVGLGSIYNGLAFLSLLLLARRGLPSPGLYPLLALVGVATVNNVAYFLGARFTRVGIIVLPLVGMLLIPLERSPNPEAAYLLCCVGVAV
ncbi:MAG TPA: hypothetical protein VFF73_24580, partial [Planctomycetota bacterium]|nr:hypothetical protein [Planctomycetota bacterium]